MSAQVKLYASGPGLMIHSPEAVTGLESGENYTQDLGSHRGVAGRLLAAGRIALISTGSPGLDYRLSFEAGPVPDSESRFARARAQFPFIVSGQCIEVRDGYATLHWGDPDYACQRIPFSDGEYMVDALWLASQQHGEMIIHFFFVRSRSLPKTCDGWVELDYRVG